MKSKLFYLLAIVFYWTGCLFAQQVAIFATGKATVPKNENIHSATESELADALKAGLKDAGAKPDEIEELKDQIDQTARTIKKGKKHPRAATRPLFSTQPGGQVKKWAITLLPKTILNPFDDIIVPIHEEGHALVDEKSVQALNGLSGRLPPRVTPQMLAGLLSCYENAANGEFHSVFGQKATDTKKILKERGVATTEQNVKDLQTEAVVKGDIEGTSELQECIDGLQ